MKNERQNIKDNIEAILNGEIIIQFVPTFRHTLKKLGSLGEYECSECELSEFYNNKPIELDLDHIDGNKENNTRKNLRWLCPNCHSQTKNWKSKNYKKVRTKPTVKEQVILDSIKKGGNVSEILKRVKLRKGGDNYRRIYYVAKKYNIEL